MANGSDRLAAGMRSVPIMTSSIEYEGDAFERFFMSLPDCEQAVLGAAIGQILAFHGIDICSGEWGKRRVAPLMRSGVGRMLKRRVGGSEVSVERWSPTC